MPSLSETQTTSSYCRTFSGVVTVIRVQLTLCLMEFPTEALIRNIGQYRAQGRLDGIVNELSR